MRYDSNNDIVSYHLYIYIYMLTGTASLFFDGLVIFRRGPVVQLCALVIWSPHWLKSPVSVLVHWPKSLTHRCVIALKRTPLCRWPRLSLSPPRSPLVRAPHRTMGLAAPASASACRPKPLVLFGLGLRTFLVGFVVGFLLFVGALNQEVLVAFWEQQCPRYFSLSTS